MERRLWLPGGVLLRGILAVTRSHPAWALCLGSSPPSRWLARPQGLPFVRIGYSQKGNGTLLFFFCVKTTFAVLCLAPDNPFSMFSPRILWADPWKSRVAPFLCCCRPGAGHQRPVRVSRLCFLHQPLSCFHLWWVCSLQAVEETCSTG